MTLDNISRSYWATQLSFWPSQSALDTLLQVTPGHSRSMICFRYSVNSPTVGRQDVAIAKSSSLRLLFQFKFVIISRLSRDALEPRLIEGHRSGPVRKSSHQFSIFSDNFPDSLATEESTRLWQRLLLQATAKCLKHCRRGTPCESFARMKIPGSAASWVLFKPSTLWTKWNSHSRIVQTDSKPF